MKKVELCADGVTWQFDCPGCKMGHSFYVNPAYPNRSWTFNGDVEKPTFNPSLLVKGTVPITDDEARRIMDGEDFVPKDYVCHSFVRDGKIQFLDDCTHDLRGQTVEFEDIHD